MTPHNCTEHHIPKHHFHLALPPFSSLTNPAVWIFCCCRELCHLSSRACTEGLSSCCFFACWIVFGHSSLEFAAGVGFAVCRNAFLGHACPLLSRAKVARLHRSFDAHPLSHYAAAPPQKNSVTLVTFESAKSIKQPFSNSRPSLGIGTDVFLTAAGVIIVKTAVSEEVVPFLSVKEDAVPAF